MCDSLMIFLRSLPTINNLCIMASRTHDYLNICRICLSQRVEMKWVFSLEACCEQMAQIDEIIMECASVQVCKGDGLPENVCLQCIEELKRVLTFRKLCEKSDTTLRHLVKNEKPQNEVETKELKMNESELLENISSNSCDLDEVDSDHQDEKDICVVTHTLQNLLQKYNCDKCGTTFDLESDYKTHIEICCHQCKQSFVSKTSPNNRRCSPKTEDNKEKKTKKKKKHNLQHTCEMCNKSFHYHCNLERHKLSHSDEKPFLCNVCGKGFRQLCYLKIHQFIHTGEKPYGCDMCEMSFSAPSTLLTHKRKHTGERPYVCLTCGKHFLRSGSLTTHIRTHSGEKPFKCKVCGRKFSQSGRLAVHMRMHSGEKPHQCKVCGMRFTVKGTLKRHVRTHTGERPYICSTCGQAFGQSGTLATHMKIHQVERKHCRAGLDVRRSNE